MTQAFTFVHAADLHLDALLPGPLPSVMPDEGQKPFYALLEEAVFLALERLTRLCLEREAAFLLLAGDVFHLQSGGSLKAHFALRDACAALGDRGVRVFWARGNHDPAHLRPPAVRWPDNLHIFSPAGDIFKLDGQGGSLAEIRGQSHAGPGENRPLARLLAGRESALPVPDHALFSIGVLHCAVNGRHGSHARYAPCNLGDFQGAGAPRYWALGHVHTPAILADDPLVIYPGSPQGLHINESGAHGCYVVRVDASGRAEAEFVPLAPVRWERLDVDLDALVPEGIPEDEETGALDGELGLERLEEAILARLELEAEKTAGESALALVGRLELRGRSPLGRLLRQGDNLEAFTLRLNQTLSRHEAACPGVAARSRVKDMLLKTGPDVDVQALRRSDNLAGETLRQAEALAALLEDQAGQGGGASPAALPPELAASLPQGLAELYEDRRFQRHLPAPEAEELAAMAREAAGLCLDMFEVE
ncbi:MAG: DNA repair exonuclease [Deltaproteobacteria bacterium]|jgi:hypothetical protein|nr:DNA repair exonuclease [Deltaproteobacteria bacterium]